MPARQAELRVLGQRGDAVGDLDLGQVVPGVPLRFVAEQRELGVLRGGERRSTRARGHTVVLDLQSDGPAMLLDLDSAREPLAKPGLVRANLLHHQTVSLTGRRALRPKQGRGRGLASLDGARDQVDETSGRVS